MKTNRQSGPASWFTSLRGWQTLVTRRAGTALGTKAVKPKGYEPPYTLQESSQCCRTFVFGRCRGAVDPPGQHCTKYCQPRTPGGGRTQSSRDARRSGTGTNGSVGAQAIKAAGGLCIAQDPHRGIRQLIDAEPVGQTLGDYCTGSAGTHLPSCSCTVALISIVPSPRMILSTMGKTCCASGSDIQSAALMW